MELQNPGYDFFIIVVTVMSIVNWLIVIIPFGTGQQVRSLVWLMSPFLTLILFIDFSIRLHRSRPRRRAYMNHGGGWFDLVGSLPYGGILRVFRLVRVTSSFREYGSRNVLAWFVRHRARGTLFLVLSLLLIVLEAGGLVVLHFEAGAPGANIETGGQALWWGIVTVSTVGYGEYYPVTSGGKIAASIMIFSGVAIIGIYTAWAASTFLASASGSDVEEARDHTTDGTAPKPGLRGPRPRSPIPTASATAPVESAVLVEIHQRLDHLEKLLTENLRRD